MTIDKRLFDECWCPTVGIGRVCLRGDKGLIPKDLEGIGREEDGDEDYNPGCFSIDVIVENGKPVGGMINYMGEHRFVDCYPCDNYEEAWKFYLFHADKEFIKETMG